MTPEQLDTEIAAILAMRGGCDCSLRESCESCSSFGPAARMEEALRELRRKVRGEPEPPPPDYGASVAISFEQFNTDELTRRYVGVPRYPWWHFIGPPIYLPYEDLV